MDRQIFWIIKEEIVCVILVQVWTSVRAHPSGSLVFKQEIFVWLTYVEPHPSWHHPDFFPRVSRFPHTQSKIPQLAKIHFH